MADLDWFPILTTITPHRRPTSRDAEARVEPFPIVVVDLLATRALYPTLAPPTRPQRSVGTRVEVVAPFDLPTVVAPVAWQPRLAGPLPRPPTARQERVTIDPTLGAAVRTAAQLGWLPTLADQPRPPRSSRGPSTTSVSVYVVPVVPPIVPCVELTEGTATAPTLLASAIVAPDLLSISLTAPTLLGEDLC